MKNTAYLKFTNLPKSSITQADVDCFISIAKNDNRVKHIEQINGSFSFNVETDELSGDFSLGAIANTLYESKVDRAERLSAERAPEPDIINLTDFIELKNRLSRRTIKKLHEYALKQEPGTFRAQCFIIASYDLLDEETIAERFLRDHKAASHAKRQAQIMVLAGCANQTNRTKNTFGTITFEDGSKL
jgi:hypothetical protein